MKAFLVCLLLVSRFASAEELSLIEKSQNANLVLEVTQPLPLIQTTNPELGGYELENLILWQRGQRLNSTAELDMRFPFCKLNLETLWTRERMNLGLKKESMLVTKVVGRLTKNKTFQTVVKVAHTNPLVTISSFHCETPAENPYEVTSKDVASITGDMIKFNESKVALVDENGLTLAEMLSQNMNGLKKLVGLHNNGPIFEKIGYELVSTEETTVNDYGSHYKITERFTIETSDCLGTDACDIGYEWTVLATTTSDGYTYQTKYVNSYKKLEVNY